MERLQWVKGDNQGIIEVVAEHKESFIYFQSGRRIKNDLVNEFLIPVTDDSQIMNIPGVNTPGFSNGVNFDSGGSDDIIRDAEGNEYRQPKSQQANRNKNPVANNMPGHSNPPQPPIPEQKQVNPILLLVNQSKKDKVSVVYEFDIDLPKKDVYNVISGSFDVDLDKEITDSVVDSIDIKTLHAEIVSTVETLIKSHYKSKTK